MATYLAEGFLDGRKVYSGTITSDGEMVHKTDDIGIEGLFSSIHSEVEACLRTPREGWAWGTFPNVAAIADKLGVGVIQEPDIDEYLEHIPGFKLKLSEMVEQELA